ncbi:hypothetical protein ACFL2O_00890 [Thermodesulfobacteriota bacterium]
MPLMLGIYSKKSDIDPNEFSPVLNDFSLHGERQAQTEIRDRIIFSSVLNSDGSQGLVKTQDGNLSILFSGNVYDIEGKVTQLERAGHTFKDKNCEAEFILHSFEEFGESFLKNLNGTFSFSIYNGRTNELLIANDSFGIWPLFIFDSDECLIFSTEYQPIIKYKKVSKLLDFDSIAEFFVFGVPLVDKTFFKNISNFHPGTIMKISPGSSSFKSYYNPSIEIDRDKNASFFAEKVADCINKAVSIRLKKANKKDFRLSGGADTRLILSNIPKDIRNDLVFNTQKSPYLSENEDRDVIISKMIASRAKLNHHIFPPLPDIKDGPEGFGSKFFEERRNFASAPPLGGWYGGEFLGGICFRIAPVQHMNIARTKIQSRLRRIFSRDFLQKISDLHNSINKFSDNLDAENKELLFNIHQLTRGFFTNIYMGTRSGWNDPYSFPTRFRTVFWDKDFLETILKIPKEILFDYNLYNQLYKNHFPEFIDIPTNSLLAKRSDSCIPLMEDGIEPKAVRRHKYLRALENYFKDPDSWEKGFYSNLFKLEMFGRVTSKKVIPRSHVENHKLVASFIDFEAWYRNYIGK